MKKRVIAHEFVEFIPRDMEPDKLYVSLHYGTMSHLCLCGCGTEIVTPISPIGWTLHFDGAAVSLTPSVGNWTLPCKSHYFIEAGGVTWARRMSEDEIAAVKQRDKSDLQRFYTKGKPVISKVPPAEPEPPGDSNASTERRGAWARIRNYFLP